jgi:hypothetical protein
VDEHEYIRITPVKRRHMSKTGTSPHPQKLVDIFNPTIYIPGLVKVSRPGLPPRWYSTQDVGTEPPADTVVPLRQFAQRRKGMEARRQVPKYRYAFSRLCIVAASL